METENVNIKNWKSLIKPGKLDVQLNDDKSYAKIIAEPLEKGYGLTLGNSLRRILLSSIRGTAVTAIQIDGVLHEYGTLPNIKEEVMDIILNTKGVRIKPNNNRPGKMRLEVNGEGEVCAGDISTSSDFASSRFIIAFLIILKL